MQLSAHLRAYKLAKIFSYIIYNYKGSLPFYFQLLQVQAKLASIKRKRIYKGRHKMKNEINIVKRRRTCSIQIKTLL